MPEKKIDLMTAGELAKALKAPDAKVRKAIKDLAIQPAAKRGGCSVYGPDAMCVIV